MRKSSFGTNVEHIALDKTLNSVAGDILIKTNPERMMLLFIILFVDVFKRQICSEYQY